MSKICQYPKGGKSRRGFVLSTDSLFALAVLLIGFMLVAQYMQLETIDQYSGVRLQRLGLDYLTALEKSNAYQSQATSATISSNYNPATNLTSINNVTVVSGVLNSSAVLSSFELLQESDCASLGLSYPASTIANQSVTRSGCTAGSNDLSVSRRILVFPATTLNTTYSINSTNQIVNWSQTSQKSYVFAVATLTMWYKNN